MSTQMAQLQEAAVALQCKALRMPAIAAQFSSLAEQAVREKKSHVGYLQALLTAEVESSIERRIKDARLLRVKTLEEFDFSQSPLVSAARVRDLAEGGYIEWSEPQLMAV